MMGFLNEQDAVELAGVMASTIERRLKYNCDRIPTVSVSYCDYYRMLSVGVCVDYFSTDFTTYSSLAFCAASDLRLEDVEGYAYEMIFDILDQERFFRENPSRGGSAEYDELLPERIRKIKWSAFDK